MSLDQNMKEEARRIVAHKLRLLTLAMKKRGVVEKKTPSYRITFN